MPDVPSHLAERTLRECAQVTDAGLWWFSSPLVAHTEAEALAIVEACLILDMPVTDILTSTTWLRLVDKVARLEDRLSRLESSA